MEEEELLDIFIKDLEEEAQGWTNRHHVDDLEKILVRENDLSKVVKIGGALDSWVRENLVGLLREYNDIFAWSHDEMPSIPLNLATHRAASRGLMTDFLGNKDAFGVATGKFLGSMVHERGIEANPEKIKAIMDLESPTTLKQA
ncbi:hypothetical protein LWI28_022919 [Acer negundo]|uniref:Uncharacterized protein n=1 Tax=Acer negundo TaxID=4023 RepID=A0AAD5NYJ2_ACENE|nr:hypothetical protein LWI28_022919 [Acer negundo]